jgi:hypothetical protein
MVPLHSEEKELITVEEARIDEAAAVTSEPDVGMKSSKQLPGVYSSLGALPPGALVTEEGLAKLLGKCRASIKHAVRRGELPRPVRLMGKNTWTAGAIVRHFERRLSSEDIKLQRLMA